MAEGKAEADITGVVAIGAVVGIEHAAARHTAELCNIFNTATTKHAVRT